MRIPKAQRGVLFYAPSHEARGENEARLMELKRPVGKKEEKWKKSHIFYLPPFQPWVTRKP